MIFYLTFNDVPSGIFSSQVIDVVKFFSRELSVDVKLVSFISLRGFMDNRRKIRSELNGAIVLPMFPGVKRWRYNSLLLNLLCFFKRPSAIIGRSVLATQLAFRAKTKKTIYDGRGAIAAEWKEYKVITDPGMLAGISSLEKQAVTQADFRIAVSEQLVSFWRKEFDYSANGHVVIPCTLNAVFEETPVEEKAIEEVRKELGFGMQDIIFAYSGSVAGWQSFSLLYDFIKPVLNAQSAAKLLFLSGPDTNIAKLQAEFEGRVVCIKVKPQQVARYLMAANYGLLIREESITNQVASPVKFAEYLACGLEVIISDNLGDYTEFVKTNNCGSFYKAFKMDPPSFSRRQQLRALALRHFLKAGFKAEYTAITK